MSKGEVSEREWRLFADPVTGVPIRQLTDRGANSHHLYFTNSGWYAGGSKLLFASERPGGANLFSIALDDGAITQLTDLAPADPARESSFLFASLNPAKPEVYFWHGADLVALDLETLAERRIYRTPDGFLNNMTSVTADGRYLCTGHYADLSREFKVDLLKGYVGFREYWSARPRSIIVRIDVATGDSNVVFEEDYWIGHVNASPTIPHIAMFCHEGPWDGVDNRIWGLDLESGRHWMIRPRRDGERIGHEYWLADGRRVGFHGATADGRSIFGVVGYDNQGLVEMPFASRSTHIHSNDLSMIVGDGTRADPHLYVWRCRDGSVSGPSAIVRHGSSFRVQATHVHPRFSPDGGQIVFVSDQGGFGNVYMIETSALAAILDAPVPSSGTKHTGA
ncbi:MAG: oligogalacturonate lyase family protein [Alphaproteobacteria bacterium]